MYLVRHGQTEWNVNRIIMGHADAPLTEQGIQQIRDLESKLSNIEFHAIFSSDLKRAVKSAEILNLKRHLLIQKLHFLRERSYGIYEGMTIQEYQEGIRHLVEKLKTLSKQEQWRFKFHKNIESNHELMERFVAGLKQIANSHKEKNVLVVTHGGAIRTFLMYNEWGSTNELLSGSFQNGGHIKLDSDGTKFLIKEVSGLSNNSEIRE